MINHDLRTIFVHIQKTGGNSVSTALGQPTNVPEKHFLARELRPLYGLAVWGSYFKFSIVRNPWDRLVSWWSMIDRQREAYNAGSRFNVFQDFVLERARTFEEFLERCDVEVDDNDGRKWIYRNQVDYLTDEDGGLMVDFVGRFESLGNDFSVISERIGRPLTLPHMNQGRHDHYVQYYTPAMADKVGQRFERDIAMFQYKFGA